MGPETRSCHPPFQDLILNPRTRIAPRLTDSAQQLGSIKLSARIIHHNHTTRVFTISPKRVRCSSSASLGSHKMWPRDRTLRLHAGEASVRTNSLPICVPLPIAHCPLRIARLLLCIARRTHGSQPTSQFALLLPLLTNPLPCTGQNLC